MHRQVCRPFSEARRLAALSCRLRREYFEQDEGGLRGPFRHVGGLKMLSHVTIAVRDFDRAHGFYEKVLGEIGLERSFFRADPAAASFRQPGTTRPLFFLTLPFDGEVGEPGNGTMVAFSCDSRAMVDRAYALALDSGATDEGAPGPRPQYHANYYGAYLRDTEGNKICFVCHQPA